MVKYRGKERALWYQVAALKHAWGASSTTSLPAATRQLGASVAIFCAKCNKINALAQLAPPQPGCLGAPSEMPPAGFEPALRP